MTVSTPALTPNSKQYVAVGLIQDDKLKTVSLVVETDSGRPLVAFQLHLPAGLLPTEVDRRFEQAQKGWQDIQHDRVPRFLGYQSTPTGWWLLFEYIDGYPLSFYQGECRNVSDGWVVQWLHQMLVILTGLHSGGVITGGLHPKHFLVAGADLYLVHLGLLENLFPEAMAIRRSPERLAFTAPEHQSSVLTSVAGDLYSVGAIAWWLATGSPPPRNWRIDPPTVLKTVRHGRPQFSDTACEVIGQLLAFQPGDRFDSATAASAALSPILPLQAIGAAPPPAPTSVRFFGDFTLKRFGQQAAAMEEQAAATPEPEPTPPPRTLAPVVLPPRPERPLAALAAASPTVPVSVAPAGREDSTVKWILRAAVLMTIVALVLRFGVAAQQMVVDVSATWSSSHWHVVSGHLLRQAGGEQPTPVTVLDVGPALFRAEGGDDDLVVMRSGQHSELRVRGQSTFELTDMRRNEVRLRFDSGHAWVDPSGHEDITMVLPRGQLTISPGDSIEITVDADDICTLTSSRGSVSIQSDTGPVQLSPGSTTTLPPAAHTGP